MDGMQAVTERGVEMYGATMMCQAHVESSPFKDKIDLGCLAGSARKSI